MNFVCGITFRVNDSYMRSLYFNLKVPNQAQLSRFCPFIVRSDSTSFIRSIGTFCIQPLSRALQVGFCFCDNLGRVEIGFGVGELIKLLDLQAPVFVGDDVRDKDHLAGYLHPD